MDPVQRSGELEWLGLRYQDLSREIRSQARIPSRVDGVWVAEVAPTSPLYDENVRPGDVIVEVNAISSVPDFEDEVAKAESGDYLRLYVRRITRRGGNAFFAIVTVP